MVRSIVYCLGESTENCFAIKCQGVINTISEIWLANCQWQMLSWDVGIVSYDVTQKPFKSLGLWDVQLQIFKLGFRISKSSNWTFWILFDNIIQYLFWYTLTLVHICTYIYDESVKWSVPFFHDVPFLYWSTTLWTFATSPAVLFYSTRDGVKWIHTMYTMHISL